jgi:hypothetical protein
VRFTGTEAAKQYIKSHLHELVIVDENQNKPDDLDIASLIADEHIEWDPSTDCLYNIAGPVVNLAPELALLEGAVQ